MRSFVSFFVRSTNGLLPVNCAQNSSTQTTAPKGPFGTCTAGSDSTAFGNPLHVTFLCVLASVQSFPSCLRNSCARGARARPAPFPFSLLPRASDRRPPYRLIACIHSKVSLSLVAGYTGSLCSKQAKIPTLRLAMLQRNVKYAGCSSRTLKLMYPLLQK